MNINSTSIHFQKNKNIDDLSLLKIEWRKTLSAPNDDYWDHLMDQSTHWEINTSNQTIGYACVDSHNCLLQFFILPIHLQHGTTIFEQFIQQQAIKEAWLSTNNPTALSVSMHFQQSSTVDSYLFRDFEQVDLIEAKGTFRIATAKDLNSLVSFSHITLNAPKPWLNQYIGNLIRKNDFFILENELEILGTCEVRSNETTPNLACLGIVTSARHRQKGLGTFLLGKAKQIALQRNQEPTCSCKKDNIGSLKAIQNNGFRIVYVVLSMKF